MHPPPGFEPTSILQNAAPTITSAAIATTSSFLNIAATIPSSTISSVLASATSTNVQPPPENGECRLLGPFAIIVQGALGLLALLALVYKRWRERPQRPLKIWSFDVSKQVVGSVLVHIANLLMSMLSSGQFSIKLDPSTVAERMISARGLEALVVRMEDGNGHYKPNPCSFYLLNLAIDTTIGIPILILLLRILTGLFLFTPFGNPPESIQSGNYGTPPRAWWWFKQSIIYFIGLMGMKICVLIIFLVIPWISRIGDWALKWTEGDEALQVIFVMLVFPVIMNATQYYIIDSFIKNQKPEHERIPDEDEDDGEEYTDPQSGSSDEINSGDEDDEVLAKTDGGKKVPVETVRRKGEWKDLPPRSSGSGSGSKSPLKTGRDYDPLFDGETSPTVVGSASTKKTVLEDEAGR